MKRKRARKDLDTITDPLLATAERVRLSGELLIKLTHAFVESQKVQRRFQFAVMHELTKIHTLATMIHGGQIVETHLRQGGSESKLHEHGMAAQKFVEEKGNAAGLRMARYVYCEEEPVVLRDRRKKWTGWEI